MKIFVPCFDTPVNKVVAALKIESVVSKDVTKVQYLILLLMCFKALAVYNYLGKKTFSLKGMFYV